MVQEVTFQPEAAEQAEGTVGATALRRAGSWAHPRLEPGREGRGGCEGRGGHGGAGEGPPGL